MELNKKTYTLEDLKKQLREVFETEKSKHNLEVKFSPVTVIEWYKSDIFKEELSLSSLLGKINEIVRPMHDDGAHFPKQKAIALFIHRTGKIKRSNYHNLLSDLINTLYHELKHEYQNLYRKRIETIAQVDFEVYVYDVCGFVQHYFPGHYTSHHDNYSFEIDANLYGVNKTLEYLKKKGLLTNKIEEQLEKQQAQYLYDLNSFDLHYFLTIFNKIVKKKKK